MVNSRKNDFNLDRNIIFPNLDTEIGSQEPRAVTQTKWGTSAGAPGRVIFSL